MQVFEDEHERTPVGQRLEEAPPGREALALRRSRVLAGALQPDEAPEPSRHPLGLARIVGHLLDGRAQLALDIRLRVGLEDSRLRLHDLRQRPEADAFAVRKRAALAPGREVRLGLDRLEELVDEPRLADPRDADEGDELELTLRAGAFERVAERVELALAPEERRAGLRQVDAEARARLERLPDRDRLRLALGLDRLGLAVVDRSWPGTSSRRRGCR